MLVCLKKRRLAQTRKCASVDKAVRAKTAPSVLVVAVQLRNAYSDIDS